ncbi:MAG: hypothetical protein WCT46_04325 [Candidatus Gracilibacteria bacterium]
MPQYKYIAITQDNQKMTGSLNAQNEDDARKELNTLGLAILNITATDSPQTTPTSIKETPQTQPQPPEVPRKIEEIPIKTTQKDLSKADGKILIKFEFEARDKTGKKIVGTIPAADKFSAFKRLVTEYQFDISYISRTDATQEEKNHDRTEGTELLKAQTKDLQKAKEELSQETNKNKDFEEKQKILLAKVDYVLNKIKDVLQKFDQEIKPENKKIIQGYIDKLLRIKNSTNLEYIEHTTEELLEKIQSQELFLHKETLQKEKASIMLQSQELMASLHSSDKQTPTFLEDIRNKLPKLKIKPLQKLIENVINRFHTDPEIASLKSLIKNTNKQAITYAKIWLKTKDKEAKKQISESIKGILNERKELKTRLANLRHQKKTKAITQEVKIEKDTLVEESANFLGWLLGFYLIYYFATYYLAQKKLDYTLSLPWDTDITKNPSLRYLVAIIFLWYILLAGKTKFFPKQKLITPVLGFMGLIATALLIFNF